MPPLPDPCELSAYVINAELQELVQPWVNPISGESHDCREHLNGEPATPSLREGDRSAPQMNGPEHLNGAIQPFTTVQSRHERSRNAGLQPYPDDRSGVQSDIDEDILEI